MRKIAIQAVNGVTYILHKRAFAVLVDFDGCWVKIAIRPRRDIIFRHYLFMRCEALQWTAGGAQACFV